jgi:hypothetical protein
VYRSAKKRLPPMLMFQMGIARVIEINRYDRMKDVKIIEVHKLLIAKIKLEDDKQQNESTVNKDDIN